MYFYVHYTGNNRQSLGARAIGVGDWLANVPRRAHRRKPP